VLLVALAASLLGGHSVQGTPIRALRTGPAAAPRTVLVIGDVHGNERAGRAVVRALRRTTPPPGVQVWTVASADPDGERRDSRHNAHGVDLNRNFRERWRPGTPGDVFHPGRRPASEPETRALQRLVRRIHPDVTIYYHQHMDLVVLPRRGGDRRLARAYARHTHMRAADLPDYRGTATGWQNATFPATTAFVVELPAGPLSAARAARHARAAIQAGAAPEPTAPARSARARPPEPAHGRAA
jgi:murein peptide amidase A